MVNQGSERKVEAPKGLPGLLKVPTIEGQPSSLAIAPPPLEQEVQRTPFPVHPTDAEPRMVYTDGQPFIVVGGGPDAGGYSIGPTPCKERVLWR